MAGMSGFSFGGVHSSVHGVTVLGAPTLPVLPDVKMGEYDLGVAEGSVVDPVSFKAGNLQLDLVVTAASPDALQTALDGIKAWLSPLSGPKLLMPDWQRFEDATLDRGWYAVLNGPLYEIVLPGRMSARLQANFKIPDPAQYGATESHIIAFGVTSIISVVLAAGGSLDGLPSVTASAGGDAEVTVTDGVRGVVFSLTDGASVRMNSRAQTVARLVDGRWSAAYSAVRGVAAGPVPFLRVTQAGAGTTWTVSATSRCVVTVAWGRRWR